MASSSRLSTSRRERGNTLIYTIVALTMIAGLAFAFSSEAGSTAREADAALEQSRADAMADAAVNEAWSVLETRGLTALQSVTYPRTLRGATYSVGVTDGDVDYTLAPGLVRLTAVATIGNATSGAEIVVAQQPASVGGGLFAKTKVHLETESKVDAYDSRDGTYTSQAVNVHDGVTYADPDADLATNGDIETKTDSMIFGDPVLGPTGWYTDDGTGYISGTLTHASTDRVLPPISVPSATSVGVFDLSGSGYTATVGPGTIRYDSIRVATGAELTIVGPATIITGDAKTETDGKIFLDTTNGPIDVFCTGRLQIKTDTPWQTLDGSPEGVTVYLSGVGESHKIETGALFTGTMYAPDGEVVIQTSGDVYGSLIADLVTMKTRAFVHLDKALGTGGGGQPTWDLVSVNRISGPAAAAAISSPGYPIVLGGGPTYGDHDN